MMCGVLKFKCTLLLSLLAANVAWVFPSVSVTSMPRFRTVSKLNLAKQEQQQEPQPCAFVLGTGFLQFAVNKELADNGVASVVMTDKAKREGVVLNWCPPPAIVVTNGEGEWEEEAKSCTSLIVSPEASDIPGRTVEALLSKMPNVKRVVVVSPAGTSTGETLSGKEKEDNWLFNRMMILGGKRVGSAGDNIEYAKSVEDVVKKAAREGGISEAVIIHRGILKGGGGDDCLGDQYYKVCGSEPEEILERTYDNARKGVKIVNGDGIDVSSRVVIKGDKDDEEVSAKNLREEVKNKTSRISLSLAIVAALKMKNPPSEFSVLCDFSEEKPSLASVADKIEGISRVAAA